ncbi:MAG: thioesterase family protein [Oceanicaulis sp.]
MELLWRGAANTWECDELGHMNVRFYLAKASEAIGVLSQLIGMRGAFQRKATATLAAREMTVRFLAEARPGAPLAIRGGVIDHDETGLTAALILDHCALGKPAAAFTVRLEHVDPLTGKVFPFAARTRTALDALRVERPGDCEARSLSAGPPADISLRRADALGLETLARGMINPGETDVFGRMRLEFCFGKISNSVIHLQSGFPEQWEAYRSGAALTAASAVLEARLIFRRFPPTGAGYVIRSGVSYVNEKVRTITHWVCDPATGAGLWSMEAVACLMDLETRKLARIDAETLAVMRSHLVEGLAP